VTLKLVKEPSVPLHEGPEYEYRLQEAVLDTYN
jgi:hypothetical protein